MINQLTQSPDTLDRLAAEAVETAARGLSHYIDDRGHSTKGVDWEALTACVRRHVKEALPEALDAAKAAFGARMGAYAAPTFRSAMVVAGANAGKEYFGEK